MPEAIHPSLTSRRRRSAFFPAVQAPHVISRRQLLGFGALAAGALAFGPSFWKGALAAEGLRVGPGPYGPPQAADENGLMLPKGFTSRVIAKGGEPIVLPGKAPYTWHTFSDGQATFATTGGGWILVANSESAPPDAGSSAIKFDSDGEIVDAYRILTGTDRNCAGGRTPEGKWLSCEEAEDGLVWECTPGAASEGVPRPAMGMFKHEAVAVDPVDKRLYMTEDEEDGAFYRFTPASYPDLAAGLLEVAIVDCGPNGGRVRWEAVPSPAAVPIPTRDQVPGTTRFDGGEGIWWDSGVVYFSTKGDDKIRGYDTAAATLEVIYDAAAFPEAPLTGLDNITVSSFGDLYVCEDGGDFDIGIITPDREVARFCTLTGPDTKAGAVDSELAGVILSPDETRMYFSSQRGRGLGDAPLGRVYEVKGPFRSSPADRTGPRGSVLACGPGDGGRGNDAGSSSGGSGSSQGPAAVLGLQRDVRPPGLLARAARTVTVATFLRRGLAIRVRLDEPGTAVIALRTSALASTKAPRGSAPLPRSITLARGRATFAKPGEKVVRLRVLPSAKRYLRRRRSFVARLTVQAKDLAGNSKIATRAMRIRN